MDTKLMTATEPDWIRSALAKHCRWIESVQGVSIEKTAVLLVSNNFSSLAARQILRGVPLAKLHHGPTAKLRASATAIEFPHGMPPLMRARVSTKSRMALRKRCEWEIIWGDTPVAIRFKQLEGAIIAMALPYHDRDSTRWSEVVICRQDEVALVAKMIQESEAEVRQNGPFYSTGGGFKSVKSSSWDDLVLDQTVSQLVKNDYESFFARADWFRTLKLPFRRGYLLHGPPGNGKTSVIRAMLSRPGMRGLTLNFFSPDVDDDDLEAMFERAAQCAPSIVVMEDIDRAFPKNQVSGTRSKVSLQQLLNCLDGIGTRDGVLVAATANEPTALDPAILKRPGRFDRVVLFPNPTAELRLLYLRKLNCQLAESELKTALESSDGFSFAQMREAYILAGQAAFDRRGEIESDDILEAVRTLCRGFRAAKERGDAAGFAPLRNSNPRPSAPKAGRPKKAKSCKISAIQALLNQCACGTL
jgi:ATP-dependent 26S proteasome regulatory subunit